MPPPQQFLSNRLRGYICKSCLSKLRAPRRRYQSPWALRTFATEEKPKKDKGVWDVPHGTVRYFEQTPDGVRTEIEDKDEKAFMASLRKQLKRFEERTGKTMDDLEEEDLKHLFGATIVDLQREKASNGGFGGPSLGAQPPAGVRKAMEEMAAQSKDIQSRLDFINSFDLDNLSEQDRVRLREGLLKSVEKGKLPEASIPQSLEIGRIKNKSPLASRVLALPIASFPLKDQKFIRNLEEYITSGATRLEERRPRRKKVKKYGLNTDARIFGTWRAYIMCRKALKSAPHLVPASFWTSLWDILSKDDIHNLDRMSHLQVLGDDMIKCSFDMSPAQKLLYIEAKFVDGSQDDAIATWINMRQGSPEMKDMKEYWDLGSRMFCRHGLVDRAIRCADKILHNTNDPGDFRLLIPIIGAVLKSGDKSALQRAWALYIRLRFNLGRDFTMEDYDTLITLFMNANHGEQALSIFKDMMITNEPKTAGDSLGQYTDFVGKFAILSSLKIHTTELDWQDFKTVDVLPSRFNNPIFFGSWLKKLIGDGELDSAEKVYNIMQERGIRPTSISINGLLGAWFRKGDEKHRAKAEGLAWQMIMARQDFVMQRQWKHRIFQGEGLSRLITTDNKPNFKPVTYIPIATIETFAIILEQYLRRQSFQDVPALFAALEKAQIKPNTHFLNQMLLVHAKAKSVDWALETYRSLTHRDKLGGCTVRPDFDTYQILWENIARAADPVRIPSKNLMENPRFLFHDMIQHMKNHGGPLPNELYQTIILCFCLKKDQVGAVVALRCLQKYFGNYPTEVTARAIVLQMSRTGLMNHAGLAAPRRLDTRSQVTRHRIQGVTQALSILKERRTRELRESGIEWDELEGNDKLEETLSILLRLLKYGYEHKPMTGQTLKSAEEARRLAASQMGVVECGQWDDV